MAHSLPSSNNSSSMFKVARILENIDQYVLDFSPQGVETTRAISNTLNSEADKSYEKNFGNMVNDRNEKIKSIDIGPQPFFKSYSQILNNDNMSKELLKNNTQFINEETILSLTQLAVDEEADCEFASMRNIARQTMLMKYIVNLMNTTTNDANRCIELFFHRFSSNQSYQRQFEKDFYTFRQDLRARGLKIDFVREKEEKEKKFLDAGSLNPKIVMESLPEELKQCLKARDPTKLQVLLSKMSKEEATDVIDRCLRSGLLTTKPKSLDNEQSTNDVEVKLQDNKKVEL